MSGIAGAVVKAQKAHARKPADFYPTPPAATQALLDRLELAPDTYIWEPACGDGAISEVLLSAGMRVQSSDLRKTGYGAFNHDFLDPGIIPQCDWIITNPPFSHAREFIEMALRLSPNVAMLLKATYFHARSRLDLYRAQPPSMVLPLTWRPAFLEAERGRSPIMEVAWFVWRKGDEGAVYEPLEKPAAWFMRPDPAALDDEMDDYLSDLIG